MILKNIDMSLMIQSLRPALKLKTMLGYAAARNYRILSDSLTEYESFKRDLIEKYGNEEKSEFGESVIAIKIDSPEFNEFCAELEPFNNIEHDVKIMTVKYDEAIGNLSGEEIIAIDWMLND